jgi:hypothetical protein
MISIVHAGFESYIIAASFFSLAFAVVTIRLRHTLTPFHLCLFFFAIELVLASVPLMKHDPYGRTHIERPLRDTNIIVFGSAFSLATASLFLRRPRNYRLACYHIATRVPRKAIIAAFLFITLVGSANSYRALGTFPLFAMAKEGLSYSEVFQGFITFAGWGSARALATWLALEICVNRDRLTQFLFKKADLILSTGFAVCLNVLDAQRNMLIIAIFLFIFALSIRGLVAFRHYIIVSTFVLAYFVVAADFRLGEDIRRSDVIRAITGNEQVDNSIGHVVTYLEPNIHNLNNLVSLKAKHTHGLVLAFQLIPHTILGLFLHKPESAVELLIQEEMLAQPGLTFRTIYADLYRDFGAIGALLIALLVYIAAVYNFNRAAEKPRCMLFYLLLAPGVFFFPFLNLMVGIPTILPLSLLVLLRFVDDRAQQNGS